MTGNQNANRFDKILAADNQGATSGGRPSVGKNTCNWRRLHKGRTAQPERFSQSPFPSTSPDGGLSEPNDILREATRQDTGQQDNTFPAKATKMRVATLCCCGVFLPAVVTGTSAAAWSLFGNSAEKPHQTAESHIHRPEFHDEAVQRLLRSEDDLQEELNNIPVGGQASSGGTAGDSGRRLSEQLAVDPNPAQGATREGSTSRFSRIEAESLSPLAENRSATETAEAAVVEDSAGHATDGKATRRLTIEESGDQGKPKISDHVEGTSRRLSTLRGVVEEASEGTGNVPQAGPLPVPETASAVPRFLTAVDGKGRQLTGESGSPTHAEGSTRRLADDAGVGCSVEHQGKNSEGCAREARPDTPKMQLADGLAPESNSRRLQVERNVMQQELPSNEATHNVTRLLSEVSGQGGSGEQGSPLLGRVATTEASLAPSAAQVTPVGSGGEDTSRRLSALRGFSVAADIGTVSAAPTAAHSNGGGANFLPWIFEQGGGKGRRLSEPTASPKSEEVMSSATPDSTRRLADETDERGAVKHENPSNATKSVESGDVPKRGETNLQSVIGSTV